MTVSKEKLLSNRLPEADVEVEGVGTVRVRGLSRSEAMSIQGADGVSEIERRMLAMAMVDPVLTEDEVAQWQAASTAGELEPVTQKVAELSGMNDGAAKEAYKEFESNPDAEFRVLPRPEARHDGGSPQR